MNISEYEEFDDNKLYLKTFIYSFVVGFLLVLCIIGLIYLKKNTYYENKLIVDSNETMTYVLKEDVNKIVNNHELMINQKKYYYKINELELINDVNPGYLVRLKIYNFDNYVKDSNLEYKVLVKKESIFNYLLRIIGGKE